LVEHTPSSIATLQLTNCSCTLPLSQRLNAACCNMQAVRTKRSAASKDTLPDEVFHRIRGALFFGPGFKVTRNKLLFRDNLQELLAAAVPGVHNPQTWTVLSMQLFALLPDGSCSDVIIKQLPGPGQDDPR